MTQMFPFEMKRKVVFFFSNIGVSCNMKNYEILLLLMKTKNNKNVSKGNFSPNH